MDATKQVANDVLRFPHNREYLKTIEVDVATEDVKNYVLTHVYVTLLVVMNKYWKGSEQAFSQRLRYLYACFTGCKIYTSSMKLNALWAI